jgi:hypothetical protein
MSVATTQPWKRIGAGIVLAAAATVGGVAVTAAPAAAAPTGCTTSKIYQVPGFVISHCKSGTGYFRAVAYCSNTPGGWGVWRWGPWVGTNLGSTAVCPSSHRYLVDGYTETR